MMIPDWRLQTEEVWLVVSSLSERSNNVSVIATLGSPEQTGRDVS